MPKAKHIALVIAGATLVLAGITLWIYVSHEREHDHTDYGWPAMIVMLLVASIAMTVWSVYRNLKDSHEAKDIRTLLLNAKYEHGVELSKQQKLLEQQTQAVQNERAYWEPLNLEVKESLGREIVSLKRTIEIRDEKIGELVQQHQEELKRKDSDHEADKKQVRLSMFEQIQAQYTPKEEMLRLEIAAKLKGAPRLIVRCPKGSSLDGGLLITNDGENAAVNVIVGPLIHREVHAIIPRKSPFGSIMSKETQERGVLIAQSRPNDTSTSIWDTMRRSSIVDPQPMDSVIISFEDTRGNQFDQEFVLTSEVDGSVTWKPEMVQVRNSSPASSVAL
jgi:hypothetical protein